MNLTPSYSSLSCHVILYTQDGELWGWGDNEAGSVGTGDKLPCLEPRRVKLDKRLVQFASGWNHNLALTEDGRLFVWGINGESQLGLGDEEDRDTPVPLEMPNSLPVKKITCGRDCSFAVTSDGSLFGWGVNDYGQVGSHYPTDRPTLIPLPSKVDELWAGRDHIIARSEAGEVYIWGHNWSSQCGVRSCRQVLPEQNKNLNFSEYFPGGGHYLAIDSEGMVWGWGRNNWLQLGFAGKTKLRKPQKVFPEPVRTLAAGLNHNLVLTKKGNVMGWGRAIAGQLGIRGNDTEAPKKIELPTESPVVFLFCGAHCSAIGTLDGSFYVLGKQLFQLKDPKEYGDFKLFPKIVENVKIHLPVKFIQKWWEEIAAWLFLGCGDENSIFYFLPKEILFTFVCVIVSNIM
jgi:alpha-tubulin suppressor-like RCC1 family protein